MAGVSLCSPPPDTVGYEQLQHRVLGIRHFKPDGSVFFRPSGGAALSVDVSLPTTNTGASAENERGSLAPPQGRGDFGAQGFDRDRALLGKVCVLVVAVAAGIAAAADLIELFFEFTKDDEPPETKILIININQSGDGEIDVDIDSDFVNEDGTGLCDTCKMDVKAGACVENCEGYDKDAINNGLQTNILKV